MGTLFELCSHRSISRSMLFGKTLATKIVTATSPAFMFVRRFQHAPPTVTPLSLPFQKTRMHLEVGSTQRGNTECACLAQNTPHL